MVSDDGGLLPVPRECDEHLSLGRLDGLLGVDGVLDHGAVQRRSQRHRPQLHVVVQRNRVLGRHLDVGGEDLPVVQINDVQIT